jgi:death-on-curing protein
MIHLPSYLPSVDRIVDIHGEGMRLYGGMLDFRVDRACIEGAIGGSWTATLYASEDSEADPDALQFSTHLFCRLNKNHCFTDGVKRVSWMTRVHAAAGAED